jgi:hypothetical protein
MYMVINVQMLSILCTSLVINLCPDTIGQAHAAALRRPLACRDAARSRFDPYDYLDDASGLDSRNRVCVSRAQVSVGCVQ